MSIIPILIVVVIVFAIVAFMSRIMKGTANRQGKYVYSHRIRWVFSGYVAILLICVGIDALLPSNEIPDRKIVNNQDLEKERLDLVDFAAKGRIDQVDSKYIDKKWNLDYPDHQLDIAVKNDEFFSEQIVVERKKTNDNKIEAIYYKSRSSMNDMDITELINTPSLELGGNRLTLIKPEKVMLKFTQFQNAFTVTQFTGEIGINHSTSFFEGQSMLYLKIPKDLELADKSNLNINFVE